MDQKRYQKLRRKVYHLWGKFCRHEIQYSEYLSAAMPIKEEMKRMEQPIFIIK